LKFEDAVEVILDIEGGLVNHPDDPGLLTKWGISLRSFPELGMDGIINLTRGDAARIYREHYWSKVCYKMPEFLRLAVFDAAVHHGPVQAIRLLQRGLNKVQAGLKVDGIAGPRTLQAINRGKPREVLVQMLRERQRFLAALSNYRVFQEGWEKRVLTIAIQSAV
jgi:lysozyme family protein